MRLPFVSRKAYEIVIYKLECILCEATGGKLSKHTYPLMTMESCIFDHIQDCCEVAVKEALAERRDT